MDTLFPPPPPTARCRRGLTSPPGYPPGDLRADTAAPAAPRRVVASKMMRRMCDVCVVFTSTDEDGRTRLLPWWLDNTVRVPAC